MKSDSEVAWFGDGRGELSRVELLLARTLAWLISCLESRVWVTAAWRPVWLAAAGCLRLWAWQSGWPSLPGASPLPGRWSPDTWMWVGDESWRGCENESTLQFVINPRAPRHPATLVLWARAEHLLNGKAPPCPLPTGRCGRGHSHPGCYCRARPMCQVLRWALRARHLCDPPNNPAELHYDDLTDGNAAARGVPPQPDDFPHTRPKQTSISFLVRAHFFPFSCTLGTDEATIIEILSSRTSNERQQIKQKYKATYGQVIARVQAHTHAASALTGSASPTFPGQCRGSARLHWVSPRGEKWNGYWKL